MGIDSIVVAATAGWVAGFGIASASVARSLDRDRLVWFAFGAVLGPVALVILLMAPPGICRTCSEPTRGWLSVCWWCGEDVRTVPPDTVELLRKLSAEGGASADPRSDDASSQRLQPTVEPPRPVKARSSRLPGTTPIVLAQEGTHANRPSTIGARLGRSRAVSAPRTVEQPPKPAAKAAPVVDQTGAKPPREAPREPARMAADLAATNGRSTPDAPVVLRPPSFRAAAQEPQEPGLPRNVLATGVYVTGRSHLEAGRRYGIAIHETHIRFLGPVDVDPSAVALDRTLAHVTAITIDGRLIISEPNESNLVLAFMGISGTTSDQLAAAIVRAAEVARNE